MLGGKGVGVDLIGRVFKNKGNDSRVLFPAILIFQEHLLTHGACKSRE
jgi:hypothetical protein